MSLIYNGVEVEKIIYNGNEVESLIYNGVEAWSAAKGPLGLMLAAEGGGYGTWEYADLSGFDPVLNNNSWEKISQAAQWGIAPLLWNVGDVKMIELNGKIGDYLTADHLQLGVFILDINHPMYDEASGTMKPENNIIFGGFKSALTGGVDVALCDSRYGSSYKDGGKCFNMSHKTTQTSGEAQYGYNYGGWKGSDLRYDILGATSTKPSQYNVDKDTSNVGYDATAATLTSPKADTFLAALPSDLRSKIRLWTRWVDAVGNESNVDANVKATVDAVTLLAEFEISGQQGWANRYEKNHQAQMMYYANGNSKVKYKHNSTGEAVFWWGCSPSYYSSSRFCLFNGSSMDHNVARYVTGLSPAFKI